MKPDYKKIIQVLNYIIKKSGDSINYMKALKLLYLADRLHLRRYGRLITGDTLVAMKNGMLGSIAKDIVIINKNLPYVVYNYAEDKLKRDLDKYLISSNFDDMSNLSETDTECVDEVINKLGNKDEFELAKLTHDLPEWERHQYTIEKKEKLVVQVNIDDLFGSTDNSELNKIYSQTEDELSLSKELFDDSTERTKCFS